MSGLKPFACRALELAKAKGLSIVTAESCTAGKLSVLLSEAPGAAEHLHGSFVTYTKEKQNPRPGRPGAAARGARRRVRSGLAKGALSHSPADIAVSVTGVAGPDPDEDGNPVGRVCIAVARSSAFHHGAFEFRDDGEASRSLFDAVAEMTGLMPMVPELEARLAADAE
jgi:nicotinamide-nucleotide amidase